MINYEPPLGAWRLDKDKLMMKQPTADSHSRFYCRWLSVAREWFVFSLFSAYGRWARERLTLESRVATRAQEQRKQDYEPLSRAIDEGS